MQRTTTNTTTSAISSSSSSSMPARDIPLTGEAYRNFANAIRTSKTKTLYNLALSKFLTFCDVDNVDTLITVDSRLTAARLIDFVVCEKEKGTSYGSICAYLAGIKKFYELNDVVLNWKKIKMYLPEKKKVQDDRAYKHEEIKRILDVCDIRKRVIILLMCSTGMRIGAIADLRLKHLHKIQQHQNEGGSSSNIYQITIYEKTPEQYYTFCTPECTKAIDDYLNYRKQYGEKLTPESPLLREQFDKTDILSVTNTKPLSHNTIAVMVHQALVDAALRKPAELAEEKTTNLYKLRYDIMQSHGFRKFFFTNLVRSGVEAIAREYLMGHRHGKKEHGITELMMVYDKPEESDLFKEYLKAIDLLTISQEKYLRHQVEKLKTEVSDIDTLKKMHLDTKMELERERQERTKLYELLYKQGIIKVEV